MKLKKTIMLRLQHLLCVLLAVVLVASSISAGKLAVLAAPLTLDIGVNPDCVKATLNENGVLSITGAGEIRDFTEETAPFESWDVKSVEFGAGITSIGDYTFYNCRGLDGALTLSKGIVRIGNYAFSGKTEQLAPKPGFVENLFVEALVTSAKKIEAESSAVAEESAAGTMLSEEKTTNASGPEEDEEPVSSAPESAPEEPAESSEQPTQPTETPAPTDPPQEESSQVEEPQEEEFTVTKIKEQEVGKEIFFPVKKNAGVFACSEENKSFQAAMEKAGYQKADSVVAATLNSGEGSAENGDLVKKLPVLEGKLILPALPPEFSAPKDEELFSYEFGGWTEKDDKANVVRQPGSQFAVGERDDLYFIANWVKVVKLSIETRRVKDTVTYSVPEIAGYDVLSYQWQTRKGQGEWSPIENATGQQYVRKLQSGDGDREFRCTIKVKKQQNLLIQLFAAAKEEEISLAAVKSGLTEPSATLAVKKGSDVQTVKTTLSLPVSEAGSNYRITEVNLPAGTTFVADTAALPGDGKTFAVTITPSGSNWQETDMKAQLVSEGTYSVAHLLQTGENPTALAAGTAELDVTLQYNGEYETLTGGTIGLNLEEYSGEEAKNLVKASIVLADIGGVTQEAFTTTGRSFVFPSGNGASVTQKGGLTAGFETEYYPAQTGAANLKLNLYRADGAPASFPAGTTLVLADASGDTWSYYPAGKSYSAGGSSSITLSAVGYPGPAEANVYTAERLLFVFDFSNTTANLSAGGYYLTLTHALQAGATEPLKQASFTVQAAPTISPSAKKTDDSTESLWGVQFTGADYPSGLWVQATLQNSEGTVFSFPAKMDLTGAEAVAKNADKSLQFALQEGSDTVYFDFSKVEAGELATGDYQIKLQVGPRPGLQNGGETALIELAGGTLDFSYTDKEPVAKPAVRSLSVDAKDRLVDASEGDATLQLTITYEDAQEGDKLQVEVLAKGDNSDPNDYQKQPAISPITVSEPGALTAGDGKHTQTVTLTVPKGKPEGTFRALVTIVDANGNTVAKEPYNFIIK